MPILNRLHFFGERMIIDCISDLHGFYPELEGGDLLIVAGDLTARDTYVEYKKFFEWIYSQKYSKKILISGNHDNFLMKTAENSHLRRLAGYDKDDIEFEYLCDSGTEFEGLKIWGSPWTKTFEGINPKCKAFTCDTDEELGEKWNLIPDDTDIVITHTPPYGIFDETKRKELVGSKSLLLRIAEIKPLIHCFGHIHEQGGKQLVLLWKNGTCFINCSNVNERYKPVNKPIRIDLQ